MSDLSAEPSPRPRPPGAWREMLGGLSPGVVAVTALIIVARVMGSTILGTDDETYRRSVAAYVAINVVSVGFGIVPILLVALAITRAGPQDDRRRVAVLAAGVLGAAVLGAALRLTWGTLLSGRTMHWGASSPVFLFILPRNILLGGLFAAALEFARRERRSLAQVRDVELDRAAIDRERAESLLQLLRAQIEPHFLFNTLATLRRLLEREPERGREMLAHLARYVETALPSLRADAGSTLCREIELVEAFLRVHEIRMGGRLRHASDVPVALGDAAMPPMMLLTLVENAVKHGIDPSARGGCIRVHARANGERLEVAVVDDGVGFGGGAGTDTGSGTGLANLRARLAAEFGAMAALELEANDAGGVTATLSLPLRRNAAAAG